MTPGAVTVDAERLEFVEALLEGLAGALAAAMVDASGDRDALDLVVLRGIDRVRLELRWAVR